MNAGYTSPQIDPCRSVDILACFKSSIPDHLSKVRLWGEFSDRFYQVLVRVSVPGKYRSKKGDDRKRILVI